jgi:hypothetical protein
MFRADSDTRIQVFPIQVLPARIFVQLFILLAVGVGRKPAFAFAPPLMPFGMVRTQLNKRRGSQPVNEQWASSGSLSRVLPGTPVPSHFPTQFGVFRPPFGPFPRNSAVFEMAPEVGLGQFESLTFARSELLNIVWIVAIEAVVVAIAAAVPQHETAMGIGQDDRSIGIEVNDDGFLLVVTRVARHAGSIAAGAEQFGSRHAHRRRVGELRSGEREHWKRCRATPKIQVERNCQADEDNRQAGHRERFVCGHFHVLQP